VGFYSDFVLPRLCDLAMRNKRLLPYRERVIGAAEGRVLEIGIGSGLNLPFYRHVREVIGLEPAPRLIAMARRTAASATTPLTFIEGSAAAMPIDDRSIDTVVTTWTLCTIPDAALALQEIHRVLKPSGKLLFVEHGLSPDASVRAWQNWLTPPWKRISGACHLNRPIRSIIENAEFSFERLETGYMPGPKAMAFLYEGSARPLVRQR
jgi:ubiquinone/menaquinone biosynthesis C-methylase UbiE